MPGKESVLKLQAVLAVWLFLGLFNVVMGVQCIEASESDNTVFNLFSMMCVAQAAVGVYAAGLVVESDTSGGKNAVGWGLTAINVVLIGVGWFFVYSLPYLAVVH